MIVRPVRLKDLEAVVGLVHRAGHGLTSLPRDADLLRRRVERSVESFWRNVEAPEAELYLFVLEDPGSGTVVGTSAIVARVGGFEPFYSYRVETHHQESQVLGVRKDVSCLHLTVEHSGPTEIGGLFLAPEYRRHGAGRLLSLSRFLYMAEEPQRFRDEVIAEMRGVVGDDGRCPFWEAVGRRFFDIDFPKADFLSAKDKRFIADLMPRHPIYVALLSDEGRAALGKVHPETEPALKLLREEGFRVRDEVDIFDGGPVVGCRRGEIRTVRESRRAAIGGAVAAAEPLAFLVARGEGEFRAALGAVRELGEGRVAVDAGTAEALGLNEGEAVRYVPLRGRP